MRVVVGCLALVAACSFSGRDASPDGDDPVPGDAPEVADADPEAPDARVDAMPGFDPAACPPEYDREIAGSPNSRYRYIAVERVFFDQFNDCNNDHSGWTHLISADTVPEAVAAAGFGPELAYSYLGAVQDLGAREPGEDWYSFGGGPLPPIPWGDSSPDDGGPSEMENGDENVLAIKGDGEIYDVVLQADVFAVCECDGQPIDPDVAELVLDLEL
jgi:hypothetical protein